MLSDIASGEVDVADILFLVAIIVFVVVAVLGAMRHDLETILGGVGLAVLSLAWLVL